MKQYKTSPILLIISVVLMVIPGSVKAQGTLKDYQRAEKFIHFNVKDLVYNLEVIPHWLEEDSKFWYKKEHENGHEFILVDAEKKKSNPLFNHEKLARALSSELGKMYSGDSLPFHKLQFVQQKHQVLFKTDTIRWTWNIRNEKLSEKKQKKKQYGHNASTSPDSNFVVFVENHNLFLIDRKRNDTTKLTTDGEKKYDYATWDSWYKIKDESAPEKEVEPHIQITWSPDSKKFITYKLDRREVGELFLYQPLPEEGLRAKTWSYERALPGEKAKTYEFYVFDVQDKSKVKVDIPPFATFLSSIWPQWTENGEKIYLARFNRGYKSIDLFFVDPETGKADVVIQEKSETMVEYQMINGKLINNGNKILWTSERDNWNHIYLYDRNGQLLRQVTKGEFVVRNILHVDDKSKTIWFIASGKEEGRDPYYRHLYKINFDGSGLHLLTPENADHDVRVSADGNYFVDNYSRVDLKPHSVLRSLDDGNKIMELQKANIEKLKALGWKPPKPFRVKARDGKTNLYGILYLPTDHDPGQTYPIIDASYSGPQAVYTPKTFKDAIFDSRLPLAEIGFAVMTVDGMGTAMRSKDFHNVSYKNLGDIGAPDHIGAIRQLSATNKYLDTNRVGIYGHSAGGYDAAHALLTHPEFYKVGVSSAGNHDQRMAKAWWPEQYMGMPGEHYKTQSNLTLAGNLEGKLLLVHGDMDNNVNPACTYRFAAELVKQNKDFNLVIIPNKDHGGLYSNPYFIRKRWDYFVKHLMGSTPPKEYSIQK